MDTDARQRRKDKLAAFDPNTNGHFHQGIFGLPFDVDEAGLVLLPVPWDATVSYGEGAAKGPFTIWKASQQIDLHDELRPGMWGNGYAMAPISQEWQQSSEQCRQQVKAYLIGDEPDAPATIDYACEQLNQAVEARSLQYLRNGQQVGVVGGEHSVMLGLLRALTQYHNQSPGVLQIDAHCDLRPQYEGLTYSHASVFYNALEEGLIRHLVPVGIRDYAEIEAALMARQASIITPFSNAYLREAEFSGECWQTLCDRIIAALPQLVYVSFDIDGLDPALCPNTGTPVPGGLGYDQAAYLLHRLSASGRTVVGFDLCEVAPGAGNQEEWDGNVGARILYHLCNETLATAEHGTK